MEINKKMILNVSHAEVLGGYVLSLEYSNGQGGDKQKITLAERLTKQELDDQLWYWKAYYPGILINVEAGVDK